MEKRKELRIPYLYTSADPFAKHYDEINALRKEKEELCVWITKTLVGPVPAIEDEKEHQKWMSDHMEQGKRLAYD